MSFESRVLQKNGHDRHVLGLGQTACRTGECDGGSRRLGARPPLRHAGTGFICPVQKQVRGHDHDHDPGRLGCRGKVRCPLFTEKSNKVNVVFIIAALASFNGDKCIYLESSTLLQGRVNLAYGRDPFGDKCIYLESSTLLQGRLNLAYGRDPFGDWRLRGRLREG